MGDALPAMAEGLMTEGPAPQLIGGRERASGRVVFPMPDDAGRFEAVPLPREGTIWSWTVQRFRPKSPPYAGPEAFVPYAVGYVQLGDLVIVESRLVGFDFGALRVGLPCQLAVEAFGGRRSFAFGPVEENP